MTDQEKIDRMWDLAGKRVTGTHPAATKLRNGQLTAYSREPKLGLIAWTILRQRGVGDGAWDPSVYPGYTPLVEGAAGWIHDFSLPESLALSPEPPAYTLKTLPRPGMQPTKGSGPESELDRLRRRVYELEREDRRGLVLTRTPKRGGGPNVEVYRLPDLPKALIVWRAPQDRSAMWLVEERRRLTEQFGGPDKVVVVAAAPDEDVSVAELVRAKPR